MKPHHIYVLQTMGEGDELMQPMNSDMTVHSVAKKDFDHGATRDYGARLAAGGESGSIGSALYIIYDAGCGSGQYTSDRDAGESV